MMIIITMLLFLASSCFMEVSAFTITKSLATASPSINKMLYSSSVSDTSETCTQTQIHSKKCIDRRKLLLTTLHVPFVATSVSSSASAANLPQSTGADLSRTGTIDTLIPIVTIRKNLVSINSQLMSKSGKLLPDECKSITESLLTKIPRNENDFKRIFDSYSTPVSYKQKFLDQNAFLVYYTKGFDGPGRANIEDDAVNNIQTLQYGARNDAFSAMDEVFVELEYGQRSGDSNAEEVTVLVQKVILALDSYLSLAPAADVEQAVASLVHT